MNIILTSPSQSLIDEIVSNLTGSGKDFSENFIVFPGKRPSHFLRKALAQLEKGSLIPPRVFSIDEFIDYVFEKELCLLGRKIEAIDSIAILYKIHKKTSKPLGGDSFISADSFFPIGLKIFNAVEELYVEGIDPRRVGEIENIAGNTIPEQSAKMLQSISCFYEEFYEDIKRQKLSTRSLRYRSVAEKIDDVDLTRFKKIIFAGFFALTHSERILFKKASQRDNSLFIFQEGEGLEEKLNTHFDKDSFSSATLVPKLKLEKKKEPDFFFYQSPDTHGQVFGLSEIIKDDITKNRENTVIVLPSPETLFPLFHQTLSLFDKDNYNISMGYPLHRTPIFGFFNNLMNVLVSMEGDRLHIPDYLKFILHPYTKNIFFNSRADVSRIMFHALETRLTEKKTKSFITLPEIEEDRHFFEALSNELAKTDAGKWPGPQPQFGMENRIGRMSLQSARRVETKDGRKSNGLPPVTQNKLYQKNTILQDCNTDILKEHLKFIHENTINKFRSFSNINDFALKSIDILTYIYKNSTARLHPFFFPFYEEFIKSLDSIANSLLKDMSFNETTDYFNFFKKYITICRTPFEGTPVKGLQVLGFLETRNLKFERVFILDANEGVLPDTGKEDSLLPFKVREILGIPTYRDSEGISAYYFDTLIKGAKEVHIFFVEKAKKEKSRFVEKIIWEKQKKDKKTDSRDYIKSIRYQVKLHNNDPAPVKKTDRMTEFLRSYTYSATSVDKYLKCPLMFYYRYVLNFEEKKQVTGKIEKVEIGNFVHKLLKSYFQNKTGRRLEKKDINLDEMDELTDRFFNEEFGDDLTGAEYLLNIQVKQRMREFLEKNQIPLIEKNDIEIIELEHKLTASINSFNLRGNLDRIEKRDGTIYIIDYKTSANDQYLKINFKKLDPTDRNNWNQSIGSLQLPFYLTLFTSKTGESIESINGLFLPLGKMVMDEKIELPLFQSVEEGLHYFPVLQDIIFKLLNEIVNPDIPFEAATNRDKTCSFCDFQNICGV